MGREDYQKREGKSNLSSTAAGRWNGKRKVGENETVLLPRRITWGAPWWTGSISRNTLCVAGLRDY